MTFSGVGTTYTYVSDGTIERAFRRWMRRKLPGCLALIGLPFVVVYVAIYGFVQGILLSTLVLALVTIFLQPAMYLAARRRARLFPVGSTTDLEIGDDAVEIRRPSGTRSVPYARIGKLDVTDNLAYLVRRKPARVEWLAPSLVPAEAADYIRARMQGRRPEPVPFEADGRIRAWTVPAGWSRHAALRSLRRGVRRGGFWIRVLVATLVCGVPGLLLDRPWTALAGPALGAVAISLGYRTTVRSVSTNLPAGSVATTEQFTERFVYRTAGNTREFAFSAISRVELDGDLVFVTLTGAPGAVMIARPLLPDEVLERLRAT